MGDLAIGIDLGTTNSCVSIYKDGQLKILENNDGGRVTPSFIFFTQLDATIVGKHAMGMARYRPENGIYEVKRLVGREFYDNHLQGNLKYFSFKVRPDTSYDPLVLIEHENKTIKKTPQQLCAIILKKLKKDAEAKVQENISKVVITVPAYFNVRQREVTLAAAKDAGFTVLKLLNEPTAAALSYYVAHISNGTHYSLVYDLGGGTFDVAILKGELNNIEIIAVDGDTQLGGHDFDNLIMDHVYQVLKKDYNYNPELNNISVRRLKTKCEEAKHMLSSNAETKIILNGMVPDKPCVLITLTKEQFESMAQHLFKKTLEIVDNCVKSSNVTKESIKEIILCGGSTRIPKIQELVNKYFDGKLLNTFINPDEAVAEGAALQAAMLSKNTKQVIKIIKLTDVVPLSLGIWTLGNKMSFLIKKNSRIPTEKSATYSTVNDKQTGMHFEVYEGERQDTRKNRFLGEMTVTKITPAPPGQTKVTIKMSIDENSILKLSAKEKHNNVKELTVDYVRGDKSEKEITDSVRDGEENKNEDAGFNHFVKLKTYLIQYCIQVMYHLDNKNLAKSYEEIYKLCTEGNDTANNMEIEEEAQLLQLTEKIKLKCEPIVKRHNFGNMPSPEPPGQNCLIL